jgi:cation:H+ antiporter
MQVLAQLAVFSGAMVVLAIAAGVLVDAVIVIARRFRIPGPIAGATLAAAATSAPELGTNVFALLAASQEPAAANIGIGAIIGSAVFNLTVIIGLIAVTGRSVTIAKRVAVKDGVVFAIAVLLLLFFLDATGSPPFSLSSLESMALMAAARRGEASLAVANAIGSNTFDILICIGLPIAIVGRRSVAPVIVASGVFLLLATILGLTLLRRNPNLTRAEGKMLLATYAAFLGLVVTFVYHT